jgi:hypothetical protein
MTPQLRQLAVVNNNIERFDGIERLVRHGALSASVS